MSLVDQITSVIQEIGTDIKSLKNSGVAGPKGDTGSAVVNYGKLYITGSPAYTAYTFTQVPFDQVSKSGPATAVTGSSASFTPNLAGTYRISTDILLVNQSAFVQLQLKINGALPAEFFRAFGSAATGIAFSTLVTLSASDVVTVTFRGTVTSTFSSKEELGQCELNWEYLGS